MTDAGMPMPALVFRMLMPTYGNLTHFFVELSLQYYHQIFSSRTEAEILVMSEKSNNFLVT
jgi:hypothetical protein